MKIGDEIYFIEYERGQGYSGLYSSKITYVGKLYFQTSDFNRNIKISEMKNGDESDPHKRYFLSQKEYFDWKESRRLKEKINRFFYNNWNLSLEELRIINSVIS